MKLPATARLASGQIGSARLTLGRGGSGILAPERDATGGWVVTRDIVLGERNGLILAPMRDLIVCLPLDTEREFARYLLEEFAAVDMNALDLPPFALVDGHLSHAVGVPPSLRRSNLVS